MAATSSLVDLTGVDSASGLSLEEAQKKAAFKGGFHDQADDEYMITSVSLSNLRAVTLCPVCQAGSGDPQGGY
jgi:hypothetical protein